MQLVSRQQLRLRHKREVLFFLSLPFCIGIANFSQIVRFSWKLFVSLTSLLSRIIPLCAEYRKGKRRLRNAKKWEELFTAYAPPSVSFPFLPSRYSSLPHLTSYKRPLAISSFMFSGHIASSSISTWEIWSSFQILN